MVQPLEQSDDLIGQTLANLYKVERKLGEGGMGTVYLARQLRLDHLVVIKIPQPNVATLPERLEAEIDRLKALQHPHIVRVRDKIVIHGQPCAVLDYLPKGDLKTRLGDRPGPMSPDDVLEWLEPIAKALTHLHKLDVVHRDIKPGNIVFDSSDEAMLVDFGIAKASNEIGDTATGVIPGSPLYMAPELVASPAYDQFALATVVYECLTGQLPWTANDSAQLLAKKQREAAGSLRQLNSAIPAAVDDCVRRALDRDPDKRFASCEEFGRSFRASLTAVPSSDGDTDPAVSPTPDGPPSGTWKKVAWVALLVALVVSVPALVRNYWPFGLPAGPYSVRLAGQPDPVRVTHDGRQWSSADTIGRFTETVTVDLSRPGYESRSVELTPSLANRVVDYTLPADCRPAVPDGQRWPLRAGFDGVALEAEFAIASLYDSVSIVGAGCETDAVIGFRDGFVVQVDGAAVAPGVTTPAELEPVIREMRIRNQLLKPTASTTGLSLAIASRPFGPREAPVSDAVIRAGSDAYIYTRVADPRLRHVLVLLVQASGAIAIVHPPAPEFAGRESTNWVRLNQVRVQPPAGQDLMVAFASVDDWSDLLNSIDAPDLLGLWTVAPDDAPAFAERVAEQVERTGAARVSYAYAVSD